jgi:hypothetical protein
MKKLFLILFLAISYLSNAQVPTGLPTLFNGKWYKYTQYLQADSGFFNPQRDTMFTPNRAGCVVFRTADSILYIYTGSRWKGVGSGGGTGIYNAGYGLNLTGGTFRVDSSLISTKLWRQKGVDSLNAVKLNKSDTATMLLPYLRKADTTSLSNRINTKLNISDTATMLNPYLRKADTTAMLLFYLRKVDTLTLSNRINLKVNISDTSTMLLSYLRKVDTLTLSNRINLKKNYSDTALNSASTTTRGRSQYLIDSLAPLKRPLNYRQKIVDNANYTLEDTIDIIYVINQTAAKNLTLPNASNFKGRQVILIKNNNDLRVFFLGDTVIDVSGSIILSTTRSSQGLTLVSDSSNWIITNNSSINIWQRNGGVIEPVNGGDTLSGLNRLSTGGFVGGYIEINTGAATIFTVGGQHKFIEFPSGSTNTGLVLSSVVRGQEYRIRNSKATSITMSYIDLFGVSQTTILANTSISLVFDGTNYKQF